MKTKYSWLFTLLITFVSMAHAQKFKGVNPCLASPEGYESVAPIVKTIDIAPDITLEYIEQGCLDGIPVILLHGFTDSWRSYEMVLPHLPANFHVFAISLRGHGNSSTPKEGYHPEDFSKDIAAFIRQLGINKPVLVGHSMGSTIAQNFAAGYPSLTRGIVLAGSFADYNTTAIADFKVMIDQLTDPIDPAIAEGFQRGTTVRPVEEQMMRTFIEETSKVPAFVWKGVAAGWITSNYCKALKAFNGPALLIWGDKDSFCTRADQDQLNAALKMSTLKIYTGTGHALHWEEPVRFADDIETFINNIH